MRTGISFGDTVPALYAVIGILAALRKRDLTGRGAAIDIPMHDCLVAMLMIEPMEAQVGWGYPLRMGSRIPRLAPCNVYSCRDGYVALNAAPPRLWRRLVKVMGEPDWKLPTRSAGGPHSPAGLARPEGRRLGRQADGRRPCRRDGGQRRAVR